MTIRVGVLGATGYTAAELLEILLRHPEVEVTTLTTRQEDTPRLEEVHPRLAGRLDLRLENLPTAEVAQRCDCVFSCLPHRASALVVSEFLAFGHVRVIDFSADYRLSDVATFESWYEVSHPDPERVGRVPYGLPELFADEIAPARLVANPGCFPTSAILPLAPLLERGLAAREPIIVDSKTGVSGGGRTPKLGFHFPECNESVSAYGVGRHRHTPEIGQILGRYLGGEVSVVFTPHLIPMDRGILSTIYVRPADGVEADDALAALAAYYAEQPFVRVGEALPATKHVARTNYCDLTVRRAGEWLVLVSAIDNLVKGASGAAVQNFNLMHGFDQTTALL